MRSGGAEGGLATASGEETICAEGYSRNAQSVNETLAGGKTTCARHASVGKNPS
jgi:hypothetical protein